MATTPIRPGAKPEEVDPETQSILDERLITIDQDETESVDARGSLAEIRRKLKTLVHH